MPGSYTSNNWLYKPPPGPGYNTAFGTSFDNVDKRLSYEVWVGDPNYGSTIASCVSAISSNNAILRIPSGTHAISSSLTVPSNVALAPKKGASITLATGVKLYQNGPFLAGLYPVFDCGSGANVIFGSMAVDFAHPTWFDTSGGADLTEGFQKCLDSMARRILFQPGVTYMYTSMITHTRITPLELIGHDTIFNGTTLTTGSKMLAIHGSIGVTGSLSTAVSLGDLQINSSIASSLSVGDIIYLYSSSDKWKQCYTYYYRGEMAIVEHTTGNTITLDSPLYDDYSKSGTTLYKMNMPKIKITGIKFLGDSYNTGLQLDYCRNIKISDCRLEGFRHIGIYFNRCYDITVSSTIGRDVYYSIASGIYDSYIIVTGCSQNVVIEKCDLKGGRHAVASGGGPDGNFTRITPDRNHHIINNVNIESDSRMFGYGLNFHGGSQRIWVEGNNLENGCVINGIDAVVDNNYISAKQGGDHPLEIAFDIRPQVGANYYQVTNNRVINVGDDTTYGIFISAYNSCTINEVKVLGNTTHAYQSAATGTGIYIASYVQKALVSDNIDLGSPIRITNDAVLKISSVDAAGLRTFVSATTPTINANIGERAVRTPPIIGKAKAWTCTATPNTWTSEGAL